MYSPWWIIGLGAFTLGFQALLAAAWLVLGGMGGSWRVNQALARQTDEIGRIDERITREVKARAARASVEARQPAKVEEEAAARLAAAAVAPDAGGRPSVLAWERKNHGN